MAIFAPHQTASFMDQISLIFIILLLIFEIILTYFLIWQFFDKKSLLNGSFYKILFFQYFVNILFLFAGLASEAFGYDPNLMNYIGNIIKWYAQISVGGYSSVIGVNRCIAVAYPIKYDTIWSKRNTAFVLLALFFYPIIIQSIVNSDFYCLVHIDLEECLPTRRINGALFLYANSVCSISALCFFFFGMWKIRNIKLDFVRKIEKRLLLQSLLETILLISISLVAYIPSIQKLFGATMATIWVSVTFLLQHFLPSILLFYSSLIFRKGFIYFYFRKIKVLNIQSESMNRFNNQIVPN